jgi:hypothetical protein
MQEMVPYKRLLGMDIAQMSLGAHHKATGLDKIKRNRSCALEKQAQRDIFAATDTPKLCATPKSSTQTPSNVSRSSRACGTR